ncbi:MAG: hypothetical protein GTN40_03715 [Candidatus Aenigmarchaeota archaeon]|nr:hypothetical protein [Candidatus Aenigmarchaeota archaeon]
MKEIAHRMFKEVIVAIVIVFILIFIASLFVSFYFKTTILKGFEITLFRIITIGGGGTLGNIVYVALIFIILGVVYVIFDRFVTLMSETNIVGGFLMASKLSSIKNHYIICGAGRVGTHVADKLKEFKEKLLIIEIDSKIVKDVRGEGHLVVEGNCLDEDILNKVGIKKAKGLIACTGKDDSNVFLVLKAKALNPKMKVATRVNSIDAKDEFKKAGADVIVAPEISGGHELAEKITGKRK